MTKIKATGKENKVIYVYHHPESKEHLGWLKIGDQTGINSNRITAQNEADNIRAETLYTTPAIDRNGKPFRDFEVHAIIDATGKYEREKKKNSKSGRFSEWFKMTKKEAITFIEARKNLSGFDINILKKINSGITPREEQQQAISQTHAYWSSSLGAKREFLWNAKPRFGKTLTSYWFVEKIEAKKVLIVTNRPAISDSWYTDYREFIQPKGTFNFGSTKNNKHVTSAGNLQGRALNVTETKTAIKDGKPTIFFISLQDIKGREGDDSGTFKKKNQWIFDESWDLFIIDESHEATETDNAYKLFENLNTNFTLHLSGTPFKALTNKKFSTKQIFNWTYEDEQSAKGKWDPLDGENPYYELPRMNMFAYRLSSTLDRTVRDNDYAFDLNELFRTTQAKFVHEDMVLKFLDNMFGINSKNNQNVRPFPFADKEIRDELRHTFWLLPSVSAVRALKKLMQEHGQNTPPRKIFADYEIIDAAAKGDKEHEGKTALEKVKNIIGENNKSLATKTITLSCGQLTTGVTVKPWTAVLMLYGAEGGKTSATKYLQAAFRGQNPWHYTDENGNSMIKENCYVFDFAPDRLLLIFQDYAKSVIGGGEGSKDKVKKLLNFLTVVAEDEYGEMKELDANEVVTMPLKLMTEEIVDGKFITSNKLFNIGNIFHLPAGAREILNEMGTIKKGNIEHDKTKNRISEPQLEYNEEGNLILNESNLGKKKFEELVQDNPDLPTDRVPTIEDLPASDIKTSLEKEEKTQENAIHDHLRYFARAIPIILMAYGKTNTKLNNFEEYIDSETFQELVGITKQQFQELRDKYDLFNEEVFNSSITEFLNRKAELADYYENESDSDIFDYIPPQQTNQIYTPKVVVKMMIDILEKQNPGIFKSKNNTFLDPYMKSGLFITEIVKRLYKSLEHKIPNKHERLEHILTHQVYGFAPSKILHLISNETIFGFMRNQEEFKKVRYQVEKNFVHFEDEDILVAKDQNALYNKIVMKFGKNMKFTAVVGNPPYQDEEETNNRKTPIYPYFYDSAYSISDIAVLISPARFLFDAGLTSKEWNKKMLNDKHIKVLYYEDDASKVFPNTDIKGGIAIVYRNINHNYGAIGQFIKSEEIRRLHERISKFKFKPISSIIIGGRADFLMNSLFHKAYPNAKSDLLRAIQESASKKGKNIPTSLAPGSDNEIVTSTLEILSYVFESKKPINSSDYYEIIGVIKNKRVSVWIKKEYLTTRRPDNNNIEFYKVFIPKSMASGNFGEILSQPLIGSPDMTSTPTFLRVGMFKTKLEAENCAKYVKTKFARAMLGIKKVTQDNAVPVWENVPLQDFTKKSDIDWSKSISEIDKQLYKKYKLDKKEIDFIETHVKSMI